MKGKMSSNTKGCIAQRQKIAEMDLHGKGVRLLTLFCSDSPLGIDSDARRSVVRSEAWSSMVSRQVISFEKKSDAGAVDSMSCEMGGKGKMSLGGCPKIHVSFKFVR